MKDHNLCGSKVELNLDVLIDVAASAVRNAKNQMEHYERIISSAILDASMARHKGDRHLAYARAHTAQFYGEYLERAAAEYAGALRTHFALMEAKERQEVTVIR